MIDGNQDNASATLGANYAMVAKATEMSLLLEFLIWCLPDLLVWRLHKKWQRRSKDYRNAPVRKMSGFDDPVYKKNVQRLIERNREFEEESKNK
jgi:hypothetical protein